MPYLATSPYLGSISGMLCGGTGMPEGCGRFTGQEGHSLVREDKAVSGMHYLHFALSSGLSPLGGDREGRSYLRKADNPEDPQSRDPHCPARWTDSTFTPPYTPSHLSLLFKVGTLKLNGSLCQTIGLNGSYRYFIL